MGLNIKTLEGELDPLSWGGLQVPGLMMSGNSDGDTIYIKQIIMLQLDSLYLDYKASNPQKY